MDVDNGVRIDYGREWWAGWRGAKGKTIRTTNTIKNKKLKIYYHDKKKKFS